MRTVLLLLLLISAYMSEVFIDRSIFNDKFLPFVKCQCPLQIFYGGSGSGKSVFAAQSRIENFINEPRNYLIARKVKDTLYSSVFAETKKAIVQLRVERDFKITESPMIITYKPDGRVMYFYGLDDVEKRKSIAVPNGVITDIDIEEATELIESDYEQLDLRLRGLSPVTKRVRMFFNPVFRTHWICRRLFNGKWIMHKYIPGEILISHSTHLDNKFLTEQDHRKVENKKGYMYDVYAKGKWGVLGDLILTWSIQDCKDLIFDKTVYGLDFGFTNDPSACLKIGVKLNERKIYIQQEKYGHHLTNDKLAALIKPMVNGNIVWCDSAEPKSIVEMRQQGSNSINTQPAAKGQDSVWHSLQWLQQWEIIIDKGCSNSINEISQFQWKKDKKTGQSLNEPEEGNDHCMAALRYGTEQIRLGMRCGVVV
jgi:phage terminase large subunit